MFKSKNLHYRFYHEYFELQEEKNDINDINNEFFESAVNLKLIQNNIANKTVESFSLQVLYPGMLIGSGYDHESGQEGEIVAGFSFDYVTGIPYLPGSSLKGILRSAFTHPEYIKALLNDDTIDVDSLEKEIFDGEKNGKPLPMHQRDIFFDAYPCIETPKKNKDDLYYLIDKENITPHGNDILKNPTPLTFVKIKPGTVFKFLFKLCDNDTLTPQEKSELFKKILTDLGAGAKTNVGFGILSQVNKEVKVTSPPKPKENSEEMNSKGQKRKCIKCGKTFSTKYKRENPICNNCRNKNGGKKHE